MNLNNFTRKHTIAVYSCALRKILCETISYWDCNCDQPEHIFNCNYLLQGYMIIACNMLFTLLDV